ncbi:MAG TPA: SIR2 family protein, partial [Thermoanaerobaculia bacterium]|nr:SIR2 family protein [Thermoanaerobaculia bacterium]
MLSSGDLGSLRAWFKRVDDFPRIAELFKLRSPQRYRDLMQEIFDPGTRSPLFKPPKYFHLFRQLPITRFLTTNFDKLLEDALGLRWGSLTWQDQDELPRYLRDPQLGFILHVHGKADRFGTLVHAQSEYQDLGGPNGLQAREFLNRIFEMDTVLAIGYRLGDPVIRWLHDQLRSDWGIDPNWFSLLPTPAEKERTREREERSLSLLGYPIDPSLPPDAAHEEGILEWFRQLARELMISTEVPQMALSPTDELEPGCLRIDSAFLDRQPPATPELARAYYRGEPVRWSLVRAGLTSQRQATRETLTYLKSEGLRAVLLMGAGGEGKSTILLQIGLTLLDEGWAVFHMTEPNSDPFEIFRRHRGPMAFLIDRADEFRHVTKLLREADRRGAPTALVFAARPHEWQEAHKDLGDSARLLKVIRVGRLGAEEAQEIAIHLLETGAVEGGNVETLVERLLSDSNGFLLAAMLTATRGESLSRILSDVVSKIAAWPGGDDLLVSIASVVALEARQDNRGRPYWCSLRLFTEALGISKTQVRRICGRLVGEVSLHLRSGYRVETRHPVIAETLFPILFRSEAPLVDELEIHERLLRAAATLSHEYVNPAERKLLSVLPLSYSKEDDFEQARHLFRVAAETDPRQVPTWQAWARLEVRAENVGATDQPHTARWLFKKATEADPKNAPSWQAWALLERDEENVGATDQPHTARWLFKKATEADPKHAPSWQAWALLERDEKNVGATDQPHTARWLFKKATEADPKNAPSWQA